jgi:hypothetical protein
VLQAWETVDGLVGSSSAKIWSPGGVSCQKVGRQSGSEGQEPRKLPADSRIARLLPFCNVQTDVCADVM